VVGELAARFSEIGVTQSQLRVIFARNPIAPIVQAIPDLPLAALGSQPKWYDTGHASLCVLGKYLQQIGFFEPLER
jgi:hypothetical protein